MTGPQAVTDPARTAAVSPRVLVVEHEWDVPLALIGQRLATAAVEVEIVGPDRAREIPRTLSGFDGLVVLGGSMDPVDDEGCPWLPGVRALLREAVRDQVPTIGVCLGAQLLGMAVGGTARLIPAGPEVALTPIRPTDAAAGDEILGGLPPEGRTALAWHWWEVTDLPDECEGRPVTVLAESDACPVQAFRAGERVWGIQFHLEAQGAQARAWAAADAQKLADVGVDAEAFPAQVEALEERLAADWGPAIDAWIGVLRERR